MNEILTAVLALLPPGRSTPSGWRSMNAVCCQHRGESADTRRRGGIMVKPDGGWNYNCFNCNFRAGWTPGHLLTQNTRQLLDWLGLSPTDIQRLGLEAMRIRDQVGDQARGQRAKVSFDLRPDTLPANSMPVAFWLEHQCQEPDFLAVRDYILCRGMSLDWYPWHWTPEAGYQDRVIIPFYQDKQIVGWTGRKITPGRPRYLTSAQPSYVFNLDNQTPDRGQVLVVEGQFDAIAVDGVAVMHNNPSDTQCARIRALAREVIVVPDRDRAGADLVQAALNQNWSVSLPDWQPDIKDVADAVKRYGRLYTLTSILNSRETNPIKIELIKKRLEHIKK